MWWGGGGGSLGFLVSAGLGGLVKGMAWSAVKRRAGGENCVGCGDDEGEV